MERGFWVPMNELTKQEQIERLKKEIEQEERNFRKERHSKWVAISENPDSWEWQAIPATGDRDWIKKTSGPVCRILKRLKPDLAKDWPEKKDSISWHGMTYHRTEENILTSNSGGHCLLQTPMLCNDQEWQDLCNCKIANKYLR